MAAPSMHMAPPPEEDEEDGAGDGPAELEAMWKHCQDGKFSEAFECLKNAMTFADDGKDEMPEDEDEEDEGHGGHALLLMPKG